MDFDARSSKTLTLARELGFVETVYADQPCKLKIKGPLFDYLMVIDFESTCWEGKLKKQTFTRPEIIEFPAVLINISNGEIESEFHKYVIPTENPRLSDFCTKFTGIEQDKLESEGVPLALCLRLFSSWIARISWNQNLSFHEKDVRSGGKLASVVTWTDWDISVCLVQECRRKGLTVPKILRQWIDLKKVFKVLYGCSPNGLNGALKEVGLTFEGRPHSGICDARNTAKLAHRMALQGADLSPTGSLTSAD